MYFRTNIRDLVRKGYCFVEKIMVKILLNLNPGIFCGF